MKKAILLLIGLIFASGQTFADTRATALLLHNGQGKSFDADQLQQAVDEAVAGDAIYLSEGTFQPGAKDTLLLDKAVSLIGAGGDLTKVVRNIYIAIDGNPTLEDFRISGLRVGNILVGKKMRGLKISQCFMNGYFTATDSVTGVEMDRCYMRGFIPTAYVRSAAVSNSCIASIGGMHSDGKNPYYFNSSGCDLSFVNCDIALVSAIYIDSNTCRGGRVHDAIFTNCIVYTIANWNSNQEYNTYINCLLMNEPKTGNVVSNCYIDSKLSVTVDGANSYFPTFRLSKQDATTDLLTSSGYLGTDGTAVGAYGGATPYSLRADGIHVKESVLRVDPETRQLKVTLKVATE